MKKFLAVFSLIGLFTAGKAFAIPVLGEQLYYTGGEVSVEVLSSDAAYTSYLGIFSLENHIANYLVNSKHVGQKITIDPLAMGFDLGDELLLGIAVKNTRNFFLSGPASRNYDGIVHAAIDDLGSDQYEVGFEDLYRGGDRDYNDARFLFSGGLATASVPEPASVALLLIGLFCLGVQRKRMSKN